MLPEVRQIHSKAWLLAIFSGVLQILIFPLPGLYPLCWAAVAPLLVAVLRARQSSSLQLSDLPGSRLVAANFGQGFLLAYLSGIIWYAGTCYWVYSTMHQYGQLNAAAALGVLILFCLYLALYHGLWGGLLALAAEPDSSISRRALVLSPFLWVGLELARTRISGFPWDLLGTVQVDNILLARVASFTGVYGLSFEIMLVNTALAAAYLVRRNRRTVLVVAAAGAALVLQAGRWIPLPPFRTERTALLVQENIPVVEDSEWSKDYFQGTLRDLTWISQKQRGGQKPSLIVWPESPAPFYTSDPLFREAVSGLARQTQAWVLAGSLGVRNATISPAQTTEVYNSAALVSPEGGWAGRYDKIHLVPFGEYVPFKQVFSFAGGLTKEVGDFSRGLSRAALQAGGEKLGIFICYESVFPDEVRQFAREGAQVFVNVSNDGWYGDSGAYAQHLLQARMRAVENRRWLLRATNTGVTASIDPYGRIVAQLPRKLRLALPAPYALTNVTTFYARHGDWFAYGCAIISVIALLTRFPFGKKTRRE